MSGELFEKYYRGYQDIQKFADELGRPINEIAINWLRQKDEVTSIIGGVSSIDQLNKNIAALDWNIDQESMEKINEIIEPFREI